MLGTGYFVVQRMLGHLDDVCLVHSHSIKKYGNEIGIFVTSEPAFFRGLSSEDGSKCCMKPLMCVSPGLTLISISSSWDLNGFEKRRALRLFLCHFIYLLLCTLCCSLNVVP